MGVYNANWQAERAAKAWRERQAIEIARQERQAAADRDRSNAITADYEDITDRLRLPNEAADPK